MSGDDRIKRVGLRRLVLSSLVWSVLVCDIGLTDEIRVHYGVLLEWLMFSVELRLLWRAKLRGYLINRV